jgi:hypothetical protein
LDIILSHPESCMRPRGYLMGFSQEGMGKSVKTSVSLILQ